MSTIAGLFEVHLIARTAAALEGALDKLLPMGVIRPRLGTACTRYGLHRSQPMVTYWKRGIASDVIDFALMVADIIGSIVRVKVEAMPSNEGVPTGVLPDDTTYWEIHAKIRGGDWDQAAAICAPFGVHLFWNGTKKDAVPVTNLRRYCVSYADALKDQQALKDALAKAGMTLDEEHYEYGIYDSAPELDEGWLFAEGGKKTDFLTSVPVQ